VPIVLKSGSLNLLEPLGPVQACNGITLPLLLCILIVYFSIPCYFLLSFPQFLVVSWFTIIIYGLSSCPVLSFVELSSYSRTHGIISCIMVSTVQSFNLFALMLTAVLSNSTKLMAWLYHVVWWSCACFVFSIEMHFQCGIHLLVRYYVGAHLPSSCVQPSVCLWFTSAVRCMMTGSYCSGGDKCRYLAMAVASRQMLISANERNTFLTFTATECLHRSSF